LCAKNQADYHLGLVQKRFVSFLPSRNYIISSLALDFQRSTKISVEKWLRFTSTSCRPIIAVLTGSWE
jgi:hypothetical protein